MMGRRRDKQAAGRASPEKRKRLDALLFDMDGTLVTSELDFEAIRSEAGLPPGPILEYMTAAHAEERRRVSEILERHEERAANSCKLSAGVAELFRWLETHGIKRAIFTRNSRKSAVQVMQRCGLRMDALVAREDALPKPSPDPVYVACRMLGTTPDRVMVVGDYKFDIEAGRSAGARTCYLRLPRPPERKVEEAPSDFVIQSLLELILILEKLVDGR